MGGQFAFTVAQGVFAIYAGKLIGAWAETHGVASAWWNSGIGFTALAMAVTGTATLLSSAWWGRLHDGRVPFLTPIGAALLGTSLALLVLWPHPWAVLLARVGVGIGVGAVATLQYAIIAGRTAQEERGQLMGLAMALNHFGNLCGYLLGGILATWWTEAGNFALAAGIYTLVMAAAYRLECRRRREPAPEEAPGSVPT